MLTVSLLGIGVYFPYEWARKIHDKGMIGEDITETPIKSHKLVDIKALDTYIPEEFIKIYFTGMTNKEHANDD